MKYPLKSKNVLLLVLFRMDFQSKLSTNNNQNLMNDVFYIHNFYCSTYCIEFLKINLYSVKYHQFENFCQKFMFFKILILNM